jgi:hypothetical protein
LRRTLVLHQGYLSLENARSVQQSFSFLYPPLGVGGLSKITIYPI